jgi:hypothetical protein
MARVGAVGLVVLLLVASVGPALGMTASPERNLAQAGNQEFDSTEFQITVYGNGSARWTFLFKQELANESERQDFEEYAARFNSTETELYTDFQSRARALVAEGTDATDRSMNASNFAKEAEVNAVGNLGLVRMSFTWSAFAVTDGSAVVVGDVFEGGFYIASDQRLVIQRGPGLVFEAASPRPLTSADSLAESDSLTWQGERSFVDNRPRVRLAPPQADTPTPTPTPTPGGGTGPTPTTNGSGNGSDNPGGGGGPTGFLPVLGLGVLLLAGLGAALAYQAGALPGRGDDDDSGATAADTGGGDGDGGGASDGAAGAAAGAGAADDSSEDTEPAVPAEELLSDDERVMKLLDENGGRMKQVNIVEETGWSKSKVSMLLSEMEEDGEISKLRVGRENIISKKGMEPDAAGSPFDDEE